MKWRKNLEKNPPDIPTFEEIMLPLLQYAESGKISKINEAEKYLAKYFQLSQNARNQLKHSGREPTFLNRLRWARLYLKKANLISDPKKDHFQITESGKNFLKKKPKTLNSKILMGFPEFNKWKNKIYVERKRPKELPLPEEDGIVILLDFLGTKGIWKQPNSKQLIKKWIKFIQIFENEIISNLNTWGKISFDAFSDTIIITIITKNTESALLEISRILSSFIIESMIIQRPLRGCISMGKIIKDKFLILGDAIDEAEEYYELTQWIGISATASTHREIEKIFKKNQNNQNFGFQKVDIPLNSSIEQNAWAVNWPDFTDPQQIQNISKNWDEKYETMDDVFYANMKNLSKLSSSLKWRNTVKFFERENTLE